MNRRGMIRRTRAAIISLAIVLGVWVALHRGPDGGDEPGLVIDTSRPRHDRRVENGRAFDRAVVAGGRFKRVVLPDSATVNRSPPGSDLLLRMEKRLAFGGHPPKPVSIRDARHNMGCAVRVEGDTLVVATFGEWDSRIEGGASLMVAVDVPEGIEVERQGRLSGPESRAQEWHDRWLTKPGDAKGGYWYGPATPAEGWAAVKSEPDPEAAARVPHEPSRRPSATVCAWYGAWSAVAISGLITWGFGGACATARGRLSAGSIGLAVGLTGFVVGLIASRSLGPDLLPGEVPWAGYGLVPVVVCGGVVLLADFLGLLILPHPSLLPRSRVNRPAEPRPGERPPQPPGAPPAARSSPPRG